jgi:hypothetical protein
MLSTAGHCDQSSVAMFLPSFNRSLLPRFGGGVTQGRAGEKESRHLPFLKLKVVCVKAKATG